MCVKIFEGYSCGHCSVPVIQPCPQTWKDVHFPYCKFPAIRTIQLGNMCHGCSRIAWNYFWDQANAQGMVHGQALSQELNMQNGSYKDWQKRNHIQVTPSEGSAPMRMIEKDSQIQKSSDRDQGNKRAEQENNCYGPHEYHQTFQYLGYQIKGKPFEAANRDRDNRINIATDGMKWYSTPGQYQGGSFNNHIVGAGAVLAEGVAPNTHNYYTVQTQYQPVYQQSINKYFGNGALGHTTWQIHPPTQVFIGNRSAYTPLPETQHPRSQYAQHNQNGNEKTFGAHVPDSYPRETIVDRPYRNMEVRAADKRSAEPWLQATTTPVEEQVSKDPSETMRRGAGGHVKYAAGAARANGSPIVVSSEMST